ncbi:hypothetical protein [Desulfoferrobacter suflitae]|uniref:hypothetical protein n=1 Tax=Desulfoferrobacter suflitae TaxID=2865782 RepID=UPI0021647892|nr:hypothetical protein [Desulfoferrobacter suflitae]MCK8603270.1 hypothetical protein [Desulfoferrobacter suflitae]
MFCIELFFLYSTIYLALFVTGYGLSSLLCRRGNGTYGLILAPVIGSIMLSILPIYFSLLGIKTQFASWLVLLATVILSLLELSKKWGALNKFQWEHAVLAVCVVIPVIPAAVILLRAGSLTSILDSYSLFVTAPAEYLVHHPFTQDVRVDYSKPITNLLSEVIGKGEYFGFFFLIASFASYTGIPPYKLYLLLSSVVGSLLPISVFVACRAGFNATRGQALAVAFLSALNYGYFAWPVMGQMPISMGIIYLILIIGFIPRMCDCDNKRELIFYSLIIAGLCSVYWILLPYAVGLYCIYGLLSWKPRSPLRPLLNGVKLSLGAMLINPFMVVFVALHGFEILTVTSQYTDNIPRYPHLGEILGLRQHFSRIECGTADHYLLIYAAAAALILIAAGAWQRIRSKDRLVSACLVLFLAGWSFFYAVDFTYHFYKHSIISLFALLVLLVYGIDYVMKLIRPVFGKLIMGLSCAIIVMLSSMTFARFTATRYPLLGDSLMALQHVSRTVPRTAPVLINSHWPTEEAWLSFFLQEHSLKLNGSLEPWGFWILAPFSGRPNARFFFDPLQDEIDYTLTPTSVVRRDIVDPEYQHIVYQNEGYILSKGLPVPYLLRGWGGLEGADERRFRRMGRESSVVFGGSERTSLLRIEGWIPGIVDDPVRLSVAWNGSTIEDFAPTHSEFSRLYLLPAAKLTEQRNLLHLYSEGLFSKARYQALDMRPGLRIKSIDLWPVDDASWNVVDIGAAGDEKFLSRGWHQTEAWGDGTTVRWVEGTSASLEILANRVRGVQMELRLIPFHYPGGPVQEMTVSVNGSCIAMRKLEDHDFAPLTVTVPGGVLKYGLNSVKLDFSFSAVPLEVVPGSEDGRSLSAALDYVQLKGLAE